MDKLFPSALDAVRDVPDGAVILSGGFGLCGIPELCLGALRERGVRDLTFASNNCGVADAGLGLLAEAGLIRKMIMSYVGNNAAFEQRILAGEIEVELVPQGTLAERMRAAGAGVAAFYTPTGFGTRVAEGKETRQFDGRFHVLERALHGDYALVKAFAGDRHGNLVFRGTARNFNPLCAMAGRITVAEVEHLVEVGDIDPQDVDLPGVFVQRVVHGGDRYEKRIERRTVRQPEGGARA